MTTTGNLSIGAAPGGDGTGGGLLSALFESGMIGNLKLPNRVLMAPMEKNLCTASGIVTQRYIDYLVERARHEVGLLRVEATYVDPVGKGRPYQLGAHSDEVIPALANMTSAIHAAGGRVSLELAHCGRQTNAMVSGFQPVAPSPVPCEMSGGYVPRELTAAEIDEIVDRFARAAVRATLAGVDAVEIHGASGYLLNAFTSPFANRRTDHYGGSLANRIRFPLQVVEAVRSAIGDEFPLLYRLCAEEFIPGGLTHEEAAPIAAALEEAGVDLIDVSAGTYESILATQPPMEVPPGGLLAIAAAIKAAVRIPVATAGKLGNLDVAAGAISKGLVDFVTIGRGLHADPELLTKARSGRLSEVRRCIACAECVAHLSNDEPAYCAVNPATIRERVFGGGRAPRVRNVIVVGAGPGGMEAARSAALRGHKVTVFERTESVGGRVRLGALARGRSDFMEPVRFLERDLARLDVPIRLGTVVDPELIVQEGADVVVIATGANAALPPLPDSSEQRIVAASDYLAGIEAGSGTGPCGGLEGLEDAAAVAVIGANWTGCHVACLLLEHGYQVSIIDSRDALAYDMAAHPGKVLRERVADHPRTTLRLGCTVEGMSPDELMIWQAAGNVRTKLTAHAVVVVERLSADFELTGAVRGLGSEIDVHVVGDCARPRKLQDALLEGATVGATL